MWVADAMHASERLCHGTVSLSMDMDRIQRGIEERSHQHQHQRRYVQCGRCVYLRMRALYEVNRHVRSQRGFGGLGRYHTSLHALLRRDKAGG
jgi:hypothetical protein